MSYRDYIVFDFETGSRNPNKTQPTQIAALALDGRNFKLKGTFNSEIRPILDDEKAIELGLDPLEDEALRITGKTREALAKAPLPKGVWKKFCSFVNKYNWKGTQFFAPIPAGFNIIGFDMIIVNRLCKEYGPFDSDRQQHKLFNKIYKVDMMDNMFMWTEGDPSIRSISMDSLRDRMGLSKENAHDALQDVKDTANIMIKFMKTHRAVYRNLKIDKAFADGELYV
jgi:DNA polymerase III epsilon subunit-like protein|tara:strand:+ start:9558 stop:10235 length:678 start_codon:yes stop_codon:yes gene_type:complete